MPKGRKRYCGLGELHFITFRCYRRLPLLGTERARNLLTYVTKGRMRNWITCARIRWSADGSRSSWSIYSKKEPGLVPIDTVNLWRIKRRRKSTALTNRGRGTPELLKRSWPGHASIPTRDTVLAADRTGDGTV